MNKHSKPNFQEVLNNFFILVDNRDPVKTKTYGTSFINIPEPTDWVSDNPNLIV